MSEHLWLRKLYLRHKGEVEVDSCGFKLVPKKVDLDAQQQRERLALKRCLQARKKVKNETHAAQLSRLNARCTKLNEEVQSNFEKLNGRFDEIEKVLET